MAGSKISVVMVFLVIGLGLAYCTVDAVQPRDEANELLLETIRSVKGMADAVKVASEAMGEFARAQARLQEESAIPYSARVKQAAGDVVDVLKRPAQAFSSASFDCGPVECRENLTQIEFEVCSAALERRHGVSVDEVRVFVRGYDQKLLKEYLVLRCGSEAGEVFKFVGQPGRLVLSKPRGMFFDAAWGKQVNEILDKEYFGAVVLEVVAPNPEVLLRALRGRDSTKYLLAYKKECIAQKALVGDHIHALGLDVGPDQVLVHLTSVACFADPIVVDLTIRSDRGCEFTQGNFLAALMLNGVYVAGAFPYSETIIVTVHHAFKDDAGFESRVHVCVDGERLEVVLLRTARDIAWFQVVGATLKPLQLGRFDPLVKFTVHRYMREAVPVLKTDEASGDVESKLVDTHGIDYRGVAMYWSRASVDNSNSGGIMMQSGRVVGMLVAKSWFYGAYFVPSDKLDY
jgi:hypothetical protein